MMSFSKLCGKVGTYFHSTLLSGVRTRTGLDIVRRLAFFPINDDLFGLSVEQKQLRNTIFQFAQKELAPRAAEIDRTDSFPEMRDFWKKSANLGLLGTNIPGEYGGTELSCIDQVIMSEELVRGSAAVSMSLGAHQNLCALPIVKFGNDEQKKKYLPMLCSGDYIGALALSEPHAGSDVVAMKTNAVKKGDHYILNGTKFWITNGPVADIIVVYAKTNPTAEKPLRSISAFIVERGMKGFSSSAIPEKLGMRGSPTGELVFDNCEVPAENLLGTAGLGVYMMMSGLDVERGLGASICVGIMQACCDVAFKYAHERQAFGDKIGHFQMMQSKMADMYTRLMTSKSFLYDIARSLDQKMIIPENCASVILHAGENATRCALDAIQILGGNGYINDYPAGRLLRDAKLFEIGAGTSEIRRLIIGRSINAAYRT